MSATTREVIAGLHRRAQRARLFPLWEWPRSLQREWTCSLSCGSLHMIWQEVNIGLRARGR
jgi:hypothetical protein